MSKGLAFLVFVLLCLSVSAAIPDSILLQINKQPPQKQNRYIYDVSRQHLFAKPELSKELLQLIAPDGSDTLDIYTDYHKALCFQFSGQLDSGVKYYVSAIKKIEDRDKVHLLMDGCLNNLGIIYEEKSLYAEAIDMYLKSLRIEEREGDSTGIAESYTNLGMAYYSIDEFDKAKPYFQMALKYFLADSNMRLTAYNYSNLGMIATALEDYKKALDYMLLARYYLNAVHDVHGDLMIKANLSKIFVHTNKIDSIRRLNEQILALYDTAKQMIARDIVVSNFAWLQMKSGQSESALKYYIKGYRLKQKMGVIKSQMYTAEKIKDLSIKLNKPELAEQYGEIYYRLRDSLWKAVHNSQIKNLKMSYDLEKKESKNQMLKNELLEKEIQLRDAYLITIIIIAALILLIFILAFIIVRLNLKRRAQRDIEVRNSVIRQTNKRLKELNATKDKFFSILAHDLRNPFNSILGYADLLGTDWDKTKDEDKKEYAALLKKSVQNTFQLLTNLLTWARSQSGKIECKPENIELAGVLYEVTAILDSMARQKSVLVHMDVDEHCSVFADEHMLRQILLNLLSNAIKFSYRGSEVEMDCSVVSPDMVSVTVSDKGVGICEEMQQKIFNIENKSHNRGTEGEEGTGLGLVLVREFSERMLGRISLQSEEGKGSAFILELPAAQNG